MYFSQGQARVLDGLNALVHPQLGRSFYGCKSFPPAMEFSEAAYSRQADILWIKL